MKFNDIVKLYESEEGPPYIIKAESSIRYFKDPAHTIIHREDGPAIINMDKSGNVTYEEWVINDCTYNPNGPSSRWINGSYEYRNSEGKLHRVDGPARLFVDYPNAGNYLEDWFIHGKKLSPEEIEEQKKKIAISKEIQSHKNNRINPGMLEDYL